MTEALEMLGSTTAEVVDTLTRRGITGIPGSTGSCPVAEYLTREIPDVEWDVTALDIINRYDALYPIVSVPDAVAEFIEGFDSGAYPELIAGSDQAVNA